MFTTILGGVALLAIVIAILTLMPRDPWTADGATWYEHFASRGRRDTFAEELLIMRIEAEAEAIAAARQLDGAQPVTATLDDTGSGAGPLEAPNPTW